MANLYPLAGFPTGAFLSVMRSTMIAGLPEEELGQLFAGEPATVLLAPPSGGEMIPAVGDGTINDVGRYVVFCGIPVGADPQAYLDAADTSEGPPEVEGGPPHFAEGMYGEFTVE